MVGMAQYERESEFMAEAEKLLEGHLQAGREWGLKAVLGRGLWRSWWGKDPATDRERQSAPPSHPFEI